jgi:hypothetical protein
VPCCWVPGVRPSPRVPLPGRAGFVPPGRIEWTRGLGACRTSPLPFEAGGPEPPTFPPVSSHSAERDGPHGPLGPARFGPRAAVRGRRETRGEPASGPARGPSRLRRITQLEADPPSRPVADRLSGASPPTCGGASWQRRPDRIDRTNQGIEPLGAFAEAREHERLPLKRLLAGDLLSKTSGREKPPRQNSVRMLLLRAIDQGLHRFERGPLGRCPSLHGTASLTSVRGPRI